MEGGEQLGLCVTPDKAPAPLLFSFFVAPHSVVGPGDAGEEMGQAGVTLGAPGPQTNTRTLRGGRLAPGLQRRCSAGAWKGHGRPEEPEGAVAGAAR